MTQPDLADKEPQLHDSNATLKFPVLPGNDNIESLYKHSLPLSRRERRSSMASHTDDSSVDESLSSMGESAWDVVDEGSAASDDDARNISRQPTPFSEQPEQIHFDTSSLAENDTGSESLGPRPASRMVEFSHSRKDSSSDPPDTAKQTAPSRKGLFQRSSSPGQQNEGVPYIKFRESDSAQTFLAGSQEVSVVLTEFEGRKRQQILKDYKLDPKLELAGTVRQFMRKDGLLLDGPFKVLYVGPTEMKDAIVQKIASALAANHSSSPRDSLNSSRVTVVPISSFADDSSPDVVLIDSMGLDMNIEECKSARALVGQDRSETIELKLTNHKTITSAWDYPSNGYMIHPEYALPDLATVYVPSAETASAKRSREQAQAFLARHEVPTMIVSFDTEWKRTLPCLRVDPRLPHLCVESFDSETGANQIIHRRPIDINTFSNLDSAQLCRSLALLYPAPTLTPLSDSEYLLKDSQSKLDLPTSENVSKKTKVLSWYEKAYTMFAVFFLGTVIYMQLVYPYRSSSHIDVPSYTSDSQASRATYQDSDYSIFKAPSSLSSETCAQAAPVSTAMEQQDSSLATLLQTKFELNKSDTFQVQVVGDSHVILRPPTWFRQLKRAPSLHFRVHRKKKLLEYEFSTLFDGVYALKFLPEEAYGILDITVFTNRKPRFNETFQVEFGTPWLKVSGWQRAAQAMTEQIREELVAAQSGLFKAYINANKRVQFFFKDAVVRADTMLKEAEKFGLGSLTSTIRSTEQMVNQSKALSSTLSQKIIKSSQKTSSMLAIQRQSLANDISSYTQKVSAIFAQQAKAIGEATSGLNLISLGEEIQSYRETHFREAQKKMLKAWWKVRGVPKIKEKAKREGQVRAKNRRRNAIRSRLESRKSWFDEDF